MTKKLNSSPKDWLLVEDNDKKHTSPSPTKYRAKMGIDRMDWPSASPDLNPIENLWTVIKKAVAARRPHTLDMLKKMLVEEWAKIPEKVDLFNYISSMPRRIQEVLKYKG